MSCILVVWQRSLIGIYKYRCAVSRKQKIKKKKLFEDVQKDSLTKFDQIESIDAPDDFKMLLNRLVALESLGKLGESL